MKLRLNVFPRTASPGFVICQTSTCLKASLHRAFQSEGFDVTPEQWTVLSALWEAEGVHQRLLAEKTAKDRHNITRILNLLEKGGLVRREPDNRDRRRQRIYLTPAGKALKPKLVRIVTGLLEQAFSGMTQEDLIFLMQILGRIRANLERRSMGLQATDFGQPQCGLSEEQPP
jgi:DNA-binding MarR family transcriptional regulator